MHFTQWWNFCYECCYNLIDSHSQINSHNITIYIFTDLWNTGETVRVRCTPRRQTKRNESVSEEKLSQTLKKELSNNYPTVQPTCQHDETQFAFISFHSDAACPVHGLNSRRTALQTRKPNRYMQYSHWIAHRHRIPRVSATGRCDENVQTTKAKTVCLLYVLCSSVSLRTITVTPEPGRQLSLTTFRPKK